MWYNRIGKGKRAKRIAERLLALKDQLELEVPIKGEGNLLLATWNIREFDSPAYGRRGIEPLYYISEIISHFDLVAVQEVREDLKALKTVKNFLGEWWKFIATDVSEGKPGNRERLAYLYDTRKVKFGNIAGEVVIKPIEKKVAGGRKITYEPSKQLYRTPYLCGFQAGWTRFMLCTVHILYGKDIKDDTNRVEEIRSIARFLAKRAEAPSAWSNNLILLGDFNIFDPGDITMQQITDAGFEVPDALKSIAHTTVGARKRHYDQIAVLPKSERFESTDKAGVFDYYKTVYKKEDQSIYIDKMGEAYKKTSKGKSRDETGKKQYYRTYWRTHQMSDHLPMWMEIKTDFGREYLQEKATST